MCWCLLHSSKNHLIKFVQMEELRGSSARPMGFQSRRFIGSRMLQMSQSMVNQFFFLSRNHIFYCFTIKYMYILYNKKFFFILLIKGRRTTYAKENNKVELAISATVPKDAGIYQCVAVNPAGEIWAAGRLQVNTSRNSPAVPTSIKCRALSPSRMLITWIPPKSLPYTSITAYTVHYSPAGTFLTP